VEEWRGEMCAGRGGEATNEQQKQQRLVHGLMAVRFACATCAQRCGRVFVKDATWLRVQSRGPEIGDIWDFNQR